MRNQTYSAISKLAVVILAISSLILLRSAHAQSIATDTASAEIQAPIGIINLSGGSIEFGQIIAGTGGTVTIAVNGARSSSPGVSVIPTSTFKLGMFLANGVPNWTYSIFLPSSITITNGVNFMTVDTFTSSPSSVGQMDDTGHQVILIGATLHVAPQQPDGQYTGTYIVSIDYN